MPEMIAIGDRAFVTALAGIGAEPIRCDTQKEFETALRRAALDRSVRLVFAPEDILVSCADAVEMFRRRSAAALLGLPLVPGEMHQSLEEVRRLVEQATGASLI